MRSMTATHLIYNTDYEEYVEGGRCAGMWRLSRNYSVPTRGTHYVFNILIRFFLVSKPLSTHDRHMKLQESC